MRDWNLPAGGARILTLAADARLAEGEGANDQVWELETSGGDPPALALRTTYGLKALSMRIFPRFLIRGKAYVNADEFAQAPILRHFAPNFLGLDLAPLAWLEVRAEYWAAGHDVVAGRLTVTNRSADPASVLLELCGQLVPRDGQSLGAQVMHSAHVLTGRTGDLCPLLFMTGGPQAGLGPYPALTLDLALAAGGERSLTWVHAACGRVEDSFELARRTAARAWEAERARIEVQNQADSVEIHTGEQDWDAALAFSQKAALGAFVSVGDGGEKVKIAPVRAPDEPAEASEGGISAWEAYYLASLLPGAPHLAQGLLGGLLAGRGLRAPLASALAWELYQQNGKVEFLAQVYPALLKAHQEWGRAGRDRDGDGLPEWDTAEQAGLEGHPAFSAWQAWDLGAPISRFASPALGALLQREAALLAQMAGLLRDENQARLKAQAKALKERVEACWDEAATTYRYRDAAVPEPEGGKVKVRARGNGRKTLEVRFRSPQRLHLQALSQGAYRAGLRVRVEGTSQGKAMCETLEAAAFTWVPGRATAVSANTWETLTALEVEGLGGNDRVHLQALDVREYEDISMLLPLWAGIPEAAPAGRLIGGKLLERGQFGGEYGLATYLADAGEEAQARLAVVQMPWNHLMGEALLAYGMREEAARLVGRLMSVVVKSMKTQQACLRGYHAMSGAGMGERHALGGLAPVGLFLKTLGVQIHSPRLVTLSGKNPFLWPVTVQYRSLTVTRQADETRITFPDDQTLTLADPTDAVISADR